MPEFSSFRQVTCCSCDDYGARFRQNPRLPGSTYQYQEQGISDKSPAGYHPSSLKHDLIATIDMQVHQSSIMIKGHAVASAWDCLIQPRQRSSCITRYPASGRRAIAPPPA